MANWEHCPAVERDPGGLWAFKDGGTPLHWLYECLAAGGTVDEFAERHNVDIEQAAALRSGRVARLPAGLSARRSLYAHYEPSAGRGQKRKHGNLP